MDYLTPPPQREHEDRGGDEAQAQEKREWERRGMMHQCPFCDEMCDCDSDDTWGLSVPDDCPHVCDDPGDDETYPWGDDEDEDEPWDAIVPICPHCGQPKQFVSYAPYEGEFLCVDDLCPNNNKMHMNPEET